MRLAGRKLKPLTQSRRYRNFMRERDLGLEQVLAKYLARMDAIVRVLRTRTHEVAAHIGTQGVSAHFAARNREEFERRIKPWFQMATAQTVALLRAQRRTVYMLSYLGHAEAIGRALGKRTRANLSLDELRQVIYRETGTGTLHGRVELAYHRLQREAVDAFQLSQVAESSVQETFERIDRAFPTKRAVPKRLARLHEAAKPRAPGEDDSPPVMGVDVTDGMSHFVTDKEWDDALQDYLEDYVPQGRGPYDQIFPEDGEEGDARYQWEIEQETTEDFVNSVRAGDVDAANENGITDMVWIAVLDNKTCDRCCLPRDGMTTAEIEAALKSGELDADYCDAVVPGAHMFCRCRLAPATDDLPDKMPPDLGGWDEWLAQKARGGA